MSTTAIIPLTGSPFHEGHWDISRKAAQVFDKVVYAFGYNPDKEGVNEQILKKRCDEASQSWERINKFANSEYQVDQSKIRFVYFSGFLVDFAESVDATAIVRGIRGVDDIGQEMKQQYWNEDLGLKIPTILILPDRGLQHISSSAIRQIERVRETTGSDRRPILCKPLFRTEEIPDEFTIS